MHTKRISLKYLRLEREKKPTRFVCPRAVAGAGYCDNMWRYKPRLALATTWTDLGFRPTKSSSKFRAMQQTPSQRAQDSFSSRSGELYCKTFLAVIRCSVHNIVARSDKLTIMNDSQCVYLFLNGPFPGSFWTIYKMKTEDYITTRTLIIGVDGEHADHLTTTTAQMSKIVSIVQGLKSCTKFEPYLL